MGVKKNTKTTSPKKESETKKADDAEGSDDFDLFGEETADEAAAKQAVVAGAKKTAIDYSKAKAAKNVINKNSLVYNIVPGDSETDFDTMFKSITAIAMDGLSWGETMKVVPMCYGLKSMQIVATVLDSVDTEALTEKILCVNLSEDVAKNRLKMRDEGNDEDDDTEYYIGTCEIVSFQKL